MSGGRLNLASSTNSQNLNALTEQKLRNSCKNPRRHYLSDDNAKMMRDVHSVVI